MGLRHFRYDEAAAAMSRATRRNPDYDWNYILLAAAYGKLGREAEGPQAVARFYELRVDTAGMQRPFSLSDLKYWSIKDEAGLQRLREGMRKAGVPER
jgi:adenylate cyclase